MSVPNQGPQLQAVTILFLILSWIAVSLRCYVRAVLIKSFGRDDWFILASLTTFSFFAAFGLVCIKFGGGKHISDIPGNDLVDSLKWWWFAEIFYATSTAILKFSIGAFLLRITVTRSHLCTIWAVMILVAVVTTGTVILVIFQCHPIPHFWTRYSGSEGSCITMTIITDVAWLHSVTNCWADWVLGILPVFMVWSLDMTPRTKISLVIILALGALGSSATIVRCVYVRGLAREDFLWQTVGISIWSIVEVGIGITAASMATLKPLFVKFFSRSHLFGGSETLPSTFNRLPSKKSTTRSGFRKSYLNNNSSSTARPDTATLELNLREDVGRGHGVTTVINSDYKSPIEEGTGIIYHDAPVHRSLRRYRSDRLLNTGRKGLFSVGRSRSLSQTGLKDVEAAEISPNWESGIRKTMVVTTDTEAEQLPGTAI